MKMYYLYICPICGNEFKSIYKPQSLKAPKYCSQKCFHESIRKFEKKIFICEYCSKPFERVVRPSSYKDGRTFQFCSPICRNKSRIKPRIPCPKCGKMFFPASRGKEGKKKYCSHECANPRTPDHVRKAIAKQYPEYGPEPLMEMFNLSIFAVQTIAYREGVKLNQDVFHERVHESAREYMENHNPMHRPKVRAKVSAWRKAHPEAYKPLLIGHQKLQRHKPSKLELKLRKLLTSLDIEFEYSVLIKPKFIVDIRIGNLIIEADGDYWHGHPHFEPLTKRQKAQQKRDKARDAYLTKCGYTVIRIWESDMSPDLVKSILKEHGVA